MPTNMTIFKSPDLQR